MTFRHLLITALMLSSTGACAQVSQADSGVLRPKSPRLNLSGPRIGVTRVSGSDADKLSKDYTAGPFLLQFGWQFETQFLFTKEGLSGLSAWVPLIGGVEQGLFLPTLSWLVGLRTSGGTEFGLGPHVSLSGVALALGVGVNVQTESINFPLNLAAVLSRRGTHVALLVGFSARD